MACRWGLGDKGEMGKAGGDGEGTLPNRGLSCWSLKAQVTGKGEFGVEWGLALSMERNEPSEVR